jgi:hypothetical protein
MKKETDPLQASLAQLLKEESILERRLASVRGGILAMRKSMSGVTGQAPHGALEEAILGVLDRKAAMSNGEIREALLANGYVYSVEPLRIAKSLRRLAPGKITRIGQGRFSRYVKK